MSIGELLIAITVFCHGSLNRPRCIQEKYECVISEHRNLDVWEQNYLSCINK